MWMIQWVCIVADDCKFANFFTGKKKIHLDLMIKLRTKNLVGGEDCKRRIATTNTAVDRIEREKIMVADDKEKIIIV